MKITMVWLMLITLTMILALLVNVAQKKMVSSLQKWSQFECGFNSMTPSHVPFSFQFFLISILFLIFDIEIALVISFPLEVKSPANSMLIFMFLFTLSLGLVYEWQKEKIEWSK